MVNTIISLYLSVVGIRNSGRTEWAISLHRLKGTGITWRQPHGSGVVWRAQAVSFPCLVLWLEGWASLSSSPLHLQPSIADISMCSPQQGSQTSSMTVQALRARFQGREMKVSSFLRPTSGNGRVFSPLFCWLAQSQIPLPGKGKGKRDSISQWEPCQRICVHF